MLVRIVKLKFKRENIASFERIFEETKQNIRNFEGCNFLRLHQDINDPCIFFTYSFWESEEALENYRASDFFKAVWGRTKLLFSDKPEAWSVSTRETVQ
ncbi:putative quinol monooxygenase [Poritiphilus flavus]|uniref:Antibiotic biosynthesis monooxygenase n=1 Tax=Poritiphilus flavus TaxID=2697053 RepID=A0A6L9EE13_9FLAO|nr:antibiotic biosynthesis monooxygenase family protein [Poritiphilus flavus]NAS12937.1 antibiotic biosynthesis monooxygenase [Poritiphilus flavus]